jgi:hypothetical protein
MNFNTLTPYVSVLLLRAKPSADAKQCAVDLLSEVSRLLGKKAAVSDVVVRTQDRLTKGLRVSAITYKQSDNAPWTTNPAFLNAIWHSVIVCRLKTLFAVCCSDTSLPRTLRAELRSATTLINRGFLVIPEGELNAAFVRGETQTLWLSGTHRRVPSRADSKVLSGMDLRAALDPLQDQSFFFSAVRSRHTFGGSARSIGVSPSKSSVWAGGSANWEEFTGKVKDLFRLIGSAGAPVHEPLPVLASTEVSPQTAINPYDALIVPEDTLEPVNVGNSSNGADTWNTLRFESLAATAQGFSAQVTEALHGPRGAIGRVEIAIASGTNGHVDITCTPVGVPTDAARLAALVTFLNQHSDWFKIWYGSGHVIANGRLFKHRFRDLPFDGIVWENFDKFKIDKEKPQPLSAGNIGKKGSLFCWVKTKWRPDGGKQAPGSGWLACNDGSMEIADFIHVNDGNGVPTITLVHVKGADSRSGNREVSVAAFEIVVGQAVKNIRNLDSEILSGGFELQIDKRIKSAVWLNGAKAKRADMLWRLNALSSNCRRRVVIVQPHLAKTLLASARTQANSNNVRAKQLDTLLHSAQAACHAVGADLEIIGEDI